MENETASVPQVIVDLTKAKLDADVVRSCMADFGWTEVRHKVHGISDFVKNL